MEFSGKVVLARSGEGYESRSFSSCVGLVASSATGNSVNYSNSVYYGQFRLLRLRPLKIAKCLRGEDGKNALQLETNVDRRCP